MPQSPFGIGDADLAAAFNRFATALSVLRTEIRTQAAVLRLDDLGWLWLVPGLLVARLLFSRPALFAVVLLVVIEVSSATAVTQTYTMHVERLFSKLKTLGR